MAGILSTLLGGLTTRHKVWDADSLTTLVELRGSEKLGIAPTAPQALAAQNAALAQAATGSASAGAAGALAGAATAGVGTAPAAANSAPASTATGAAAPAAGSGTSGTTDGMAAALQAALAQGQATQVWTDGGQAAASTNAGAPASSPLGSNQLAVDAATATATEESASAATSSSTTPINTSGVVGGASVTPTRPKLDYWNSHIAQFRGKYLPDGPNMRPNCGPASVTMALRMIGLDIPGFQGQRSEAVLDKARILATGKNDVTVGTTDTELERLITASGARWSESNNLDQMLGWVSQGIPVILAGNPSKSWNARYTKDQVYPYDGGHWVTVSGYDEKTGFWVVNDPLSQIGPILVSKQELQSYMNAHGGLGIAVFK